MTRLKLDPSLDGIDHINISYQAKTELGRLLNDSSELLIKHKPFFRNPEKKEFHFTAYGFLAFLLTGSRHLSLAGAPVDVIREHLRDNPCRWTQGVTSTLRQALVHRLDKYTLNLLKANTLPIRSYVYSNGKVTVRKNDRVAVDVYTEVCILLKRKQNETA